MQIGLAQGMQMLKIFKDHLQGTSILDDFDFYEEKDNACRAQKGENPESTHQARFSEDLEPMVCTFLFRSMDCSLVIFSRTGMSFIISGVPLLPKFIYMPCM